MRTEDELTRALREAAERAPAPDLLTGVAHRRRRRTRRRTQALAAVAVVTVVAVSTAVARGASTSGGGGDVAVQPSGEVVIPTKEPPGMAVPTGKLPGTIKSVPIEKLWPGSVFTMPATHADGWAYRPLDGISATEVLLLATKQSSSQNRRLEIYDSSTGRSRVLTEVPSPREVLNYPQQLDLDVQNVVWYVNRRTPEGVAVVDLWKSSRSGGRPQVFGSLTDKGIGVMRLAGDSVVWSMEKGGVYSMPLTGGAARPIAAGKGLFLTDWPWASDVSRSDFNRNQTKVVNLDTGEVQHVKAREGVRGLRCAPVWCYGRVPKGTLVQHVDGTHARVIPRILRGAGFGGPPYRGQLLMAGADGLYDLQTGVFAELPKADSWVGVGTKSEPGPILYNAAKKGDELVVLNLAAGPEEQ
ncbi:hypothetical protein ABZ297_13975 [Nonomuraea sp. NPDC005983]|uniref:hypothetical protein n=1 Tax=Nonomuraea sp. NPDC005983 TaxID=3155595 RepID=UPI0033BCD533